jgi:N-hydroxyarylamine O-acetyltransferase
LTGPDLDAYLERTGYAGLRAASLQALRGLHEAHAGAIPFENLDILLGHPIRLDLPALHAKLVAGRRGGYCFEQNTLFRAALEALGFEVTSLAARVRGGGVVRPRTHMLLRVDLPEGPFVADVGFGGDGLVHPLPLAAGQEAWLGGAGQRLVREGDLWVLQANLTGEWDDLYAFTLEPQHPVDFEMASHYTSTHPASRFVQTLTAQRTWPGGSAILRDRDLVVRQGRDTRREAIQGPEHLLQVLDREFGLAFPPGTRFSKPEFPPLPS